MRRLFKFSIIFLGANLFSLATVFGQPGFGLSEKINADWRFHLGTLARFGNH